MYTVLAGRLELVRVVAAEDADACALVGGEGGEARLVGHARRTVELHHPLEEAQAGRTAPAWPARCLYTLPAQAYGRGSQSPLRIPPWLRAP